MASELICGAVAILGRPNVGKSTFLNGVLKQRLAIVSPKPQTTRGSMAGIFQDAEAQIVLYDTPGIHQPKNDLSHFMLRQVEESLEGADAALFLVDAKEGLTDEDHLVAGWLRKFHKPVLCLLNKIDQVPAGRVQELTGKIKGELNGDWLVFPICALSGKGVEKVVAQLKKFLPKQEPLFPEDDLTDKTVRELAAEMIREQCFLQLRQEIPYGVAVLIDKFEEREAPQPVLIQATIFVEKDSQKGIVIGAGGGQLKALGSAARERIEDLLGQKVFLQLWVKVLKDWRKDEKVLKKLGYPVPKRK
ncbi:MAG TPA: GTPase Era [bacterium]|nr:GTPase Era [bacterium]